MAHEVETMYYVSNEENGRFVPWHGLGTPVQEALTSREALQVAGLDWDVFPKEVFAEVDGRMIKVPNAVANVRSSDNKPLGIVTDRYKIVQNREAFDFTDNLIGGDVRYETAGSLMGGRKIWLLAKLPQQEIVGDKVDPYICFTNTHDGTGAIKVAMTPIRVVCNNTLNFALKDATRIWSTKHMGNIAGKLDEARATLEIAYRYMVNLDVFGEQLANISVSNEQLGKVLDEMFPIEKDASDRTINNMKAQRETFELCYLAPDIQKFLGTAWGVMNAASDFATHSTPSRLTKDYTENNFGKVINGHPFIDKMQEKLLATVGATV